LAQKWQKSPALGPGTQTAKTGFGLGNRKKISKIFNAYLYLLFFLLIILWPKRLRLFCATGPESVEENLLSSLTSLCPGPDTLTPGNK
jgi:hypothetical protein